MKSTNQAAREPPDFFADAGVRMPAHLSTRRRRWISLSAVVAISSVASGPMQSWPTLEPLLIKIGVWEGADQMANLNSVFSLALGVGMISGLLNGVLFDVLGPRWLMCTGSFGVAICQVVMAMAVQGPSLNHLLWWCYPLLSLFAWLNLSGCYAWLWLLPESQSTVAGVIGSVQTLADALVIVAVWANSAFALSLPDFFLIVGAVAAVSGFVSLFLVPGIAEHRKYRAVVCAASRGEAGLDDGYGGVPAGPDEDEEGDHTPAARAILDSAAVSVLVHPAAILIFTLYVQSLYMWFIYPTMDMFAFYRSMFDQGTAEMLVNCWGVVYGTLGAFFLIMLGYVFDRLGFEQMLGWISIGVLIGSLSLGTRSVAAQVFAQVLLAALTSVLSILIPRFCVHYVPVELFGTWNGFLQTVLGLGQLVLTPATNAACGWIQALLVSIGTPGMLAGAGAGRVAIGLWLCCTEACSVWYLIHLQRCPMPVPNSLRLSDVHDAIDTAVWSGQSSNLWG